MKQPNKTTTIRFNDYVSKILKPRILDDIKNGKLDSVLLTVNSNGDREIGQAILKRIVLMYAQKENELWKEISKQQLKKGFKVGDTIRIRLPNDYKNDKS